MSNHQKRRPRACPWGGDGNKNIEKSSLSTKFLQKLSGEMNMVDIKERGVDVEK